MGDQTISPASAPPLKEFVKLTVQNLENASYNSP
jgi:hypothetical protein